MTKIQARELRLLHDEMRACRACADEGFQITPGAVFTGRAHAKILLVGQAPGEHEASSRTPFSGPSGPRLFTWLEKAGFGEEYFRARHYIASVTRCYPGKAASGRGDRAPGKQELALCRGFLDRELQLVSPLVILPVGRLAIQAFLGNKPLNLTVGTAQQDELGRWIVPFPHPSGASAWLNRDDNAAHLERAIRHLSRLRRRLQL